MLPLTNYTTSLVINDIGDPTVTPNLSMISKQPGQENNIRTYSRPKMTLTRYPLSDVSANTNYNTPDLAILNVSRLFARLEHNLLAPTADLKPLRRSEYQRMRVGAVRLPSFLFSFYLFLLSLLRAHSYEYDCECERTHAY